MSFFGKKKSGVKIKTASALIDFILEGIMMDRNDINRSLQKGDIKNDIKQKYYWQGCLSYNHIIAKNLNVLKNQVEKLERVRRMERTLDKMDFSDVDNDVGNIKL